MTTTVELEAQRLESRVRFNKWSGRTSIYLLMTFLAIMIIIPILFMVVASLKPSDRVLADLDNLRLALLPDLMSLSIENYQSVFQSIEIDFLRFAFNSTFLTVTAVLTGLFINSMAAYVLARIVWPGRSIVLSMIISLIIIPLEAIAVPLMLQVSEMTIVANMLVMVIMGILTILVWMMGMSLAESIVIDRFNLNELPKPVRWTIQAVFTFIIALPFEILTYFLIKQIITASSWINTYHVQILPFIAEPFSIFLFYQFFIDLPYELDEAAYVDGANRFRIYWQIVVPLSLPVFATVAILKFLQFWSFYLWPLLVIRDANYRPLMTGMDFFKGLQPDWGAMMAYASLVTIPVLIVFLLFQRWFIQSVASSGVKG